MDFRRAVAGETGPRLRATGSRGQRPPLAPLPRPRLDLSDRQRFDHALALAQRLPAARLRRNDEREVIRQLMSKTTPRAFLRRVFRSLT